MRHLLAFATVLALCGPALACINYTESSNHEREFKSQYQQSEYVPPDPASTASARPYVLGGSGVLLAAIGALLLLRQRSQG